MKEGTLNRGFIVNKVTFVFLFFLLKALAGLYNSCGQKNIYILLKLSKFLSSQWRLDFFLYLFFVNRGV